LKESSATPAIAAGGRVGAEVGDEFKVYTLGEELIDPVTGEILSREELEVGRIRASLAPPARGLVPTWRAGWPRCAPSARMSREALHGRRRDPRFL
jgi:hypothetical protein